MKIVPFLWFSFSLLVGLLNPRCWVESIGLDRDRERGGGGRRRRDRFALLCYQMRVESVFLFI